MFQKITLLLTLMSSGIVACIAAEPDKIQSDSIIMNSFEVGEIPDLGHPVCTLSLANNKKVDFYNYVEGDICPPDGRNCTYTAIMKLNGEIAILKQISSGENNSVYRNSDFYISIKQNQTMMREATLKLLSSSKQNKTKQNTVKRFLI